MRFSGKILADGENTGGCLRESEFSLTGLRDTVAGNCDLGIFLSQNFNELHEEPRGTP